MPTPAEHKTVQARILAYAEGIGWTIVFREEAEARRGFDPQMPARDRAKGASLYIDELLDPKIGKSELCGGRVGAGFIDISRFRLPKRGVQG